MSKVIAIQVCPGVHVPEGSLVGDGMAKQPVMVPGFVLALKDDGSMWQLIAGYDWFRVPNPPQEDKVVGRIEPTLSPDQGGPSA